MKLNCVLEISIVILVGAISVSCGMWLFGRGLIGSIASVWAANLLMLLAIFGGLRVRGQGWKHLGLRPDIYRPKLLGRAILLSIPVFLASILAFAFGAVLMANIFGVPEPADMSKYDFLRDNPGITILALLSIYFVSSFAEEVIYRGFILTRLLEFGENKMGTKAIAVFLSSVVFGLVHSDWGVPGMVQASLMGVALGIAFLTVGRNLWITIFAHAYMDTILVAQMYLGSQT